MLQRWLVDVLLDLHFPSPREDFLSAFFTKQTDGTWVEKSAGTLVQLPNLSCYAHGVRENFVGGSFLITQQMVDLWVELRDANHKVPLGDRICKKMVMLGPMGVGQSYIGTYLHGLRFRLGDLLYRRSRRGCVLCN